MPDQEPIRDPPVVLVVMDPFENLPHRPMELFDRWYEEAKASEPNDPNAAALATATPDGVPSVRMVLIKGADERGLRIFTDRGSQKGRELLENPHAAATIHWKSLRRQVRFSGTVKQLSREESGEYFHSRSRGSQIAAAVSKQSQSLSSRDALDNEARAYAKELNGAEVPQPERWIGFLLVPGRIEFWSDGKDRLHDRMVFTKHGERWDIDRLYP